MERSAIIPVTDRPPMITFVSDFGWQGGYVAACEAVIRSIVPQVTLVHVGHEVPLGDIRGAAQSLARVAPLGPIAVHLAVVDPGVGTGRRPLALACARGDALVGPDNGLLRSSADALGGVTGAWRLDPVRVRTAAGLPVGSLSHTFHGRDLFAPAAALLALGHRPEWLGDAVDADGLVTLPPPVVEMYGTTARIEVVEVDRFGNVALCVGLEALPGSSERTAVRVTGEPDTHWVAQVVRTFADLVPGELGLLQDSWGHAVLALNGASAAEFLGASVGALVELRPAGPPPTATGRTAPNHHGDDTSP